jgi:hypothetical protein
MGAFTAPQGPPRVTLSLASVGGYDRHEYFEEKARAFEALAGQIERIINPQEMA